MREDEPNLVMGLRACVDYARLAPEHGGQALDHILPRHAVAVGLAWSWLIHTWQGVANAVTDTRPIIASTQLDQSGSPQCLYSVMDSVGERCTKEIREVLDDLLGDARIGLGEIGNGVHAIENEMRADARLEPLKTRLSLDLSSPEMMRIKIAQ